MGTKQMSTTEIKSLRDRLRLNQTEFAERLGVSQATVSMWENGERKPTGSALKLMEIIAMTTPAKKLRKSS